MPKKVQTQCKRLVGARRAVKFIESLEARRLLAFAAYPHSPTVEWPDNIAVVQSQGARLAATQPTVTGSNPTNEQADVPRYTPIALEVELVSPGRGVDPSTLNTDNVKLNRTSDNQFVNANINTDAGGAVIVIQPTALLAANTQYTVRVTSGLKDVNGAAFLPFEMTFTTGVQVPAQDPDIAFAKSNQSTSLGKKYASLAWGPDNRLYAGTLDGEILRFDVNANGSLGTPQVINTVNANNTEKRFAIGMEFDPAATADNLVLWVSHSVATDLAKPEAPDWSSKISILTGADLETYTDSVVDLPRSVRDHLTNQLRFGPDGALYWSQPSMNAMGAADIAWLREDNELSGAVLRMDISLLPQTPLSAKTLSGGGTYDPNAPGAPITLYATGVRNGYDFVWHSNGHLYMPANGSAAGGDTPAGPGGTPPAMVGVRQTMHDYVFDIRPGAFYGQPNIMRGEYILNGGNPTAGIDRNEVPSYPVGTQPDPNYRFDAFNFGQNYAPTGVLEYQNADAFGGKLKGRMLVTRYSGGDDVFILSPSRTGNTVNGINGVNMDGFNDPTDIIEDPRTGNLYVAQLGTERSGAPRNLITLLKPDAPPSLDKLQLVHADEGYSLGALKAKATFNLADLPTRNLSIKALTTGAGRVVFNLDGAEVNDTSAPFSSTGNNSDGSYKVWTPTPGMHTLTITPYNPNETPGATSTLVFWVIDQARPFNAYINFQPVDTPYVRGYKPDWGRLYALRGNGMTYGWNKSAQLGMYDNNNPASPDQRFDTGAEPGGRKWDIAVPNGTYSVFLLGGDLNDPEGTYNVAVEGVPTLVGQTNAASPWIGRTVEVTVADNTLSVHPLAGNVNHKLSFIQIISS